MMCSLECWRYWSTVERSFPSASTRLIHLSQASATVMLLLGAVCIPRLTLMRVLAAWSSASPLVAKVWICRTPSLSKVSTIHASLSSPFRVVHSRLRTDIAALHCYVAYVAQNPLDVHRQFRAPGSRQSESMLPQHNQGGEDASGAENSHKVGASQCRS